MRFEPDETHKAVAEAATQALDRGGADLPEQTWKALAQCGLLSLVVPTWLGGDGLGVGEVATLLTEVGRRAVAVPALATLALGALPVLRCGTREQQRELLGGLPTGEVILTAAVREPSDPMPARPRTTATDDLALTGTKVGVPYAGQAHRILVPVSLATGGTAVALVDPSGAGVSLHPTPAAGAAPEYTLRLTAARATGLLGWPLTGGSTAGTDTGDRGVEVLHECAVAGACALGDGLLAGALALTAGHVGRREQFGRPLATFQAVAQQIADVYLAARTVHLTTVSACWRLDGGRGAAADLDVAAYWLTSVAPAAVRTCHHLHGGLGLDVSYPLHRYSSSIRDLVRLLGGAEYRLDRLGAAR